MPKPHQVWTVPYQVKNPEMYASELTPEVSPTWPINDID